MLKEAPSEVREWTVKLGDASVYFAKGNDGKIDVWLPGHVPLKDCSSFFPKLGIPENGENWVFRGHTCGYEGEEQTHIAIPEEALPQLFLKKPL